MEDELVLASVHDLTDLTTFMARAATLGCEHVRLSAHGTALVVSVAVISRETLLDSTPTVLGIRVGQLAHNSTEDRVVLVRALADRLARGEMEIPLPPSVPGVPWAGLAPPQQNWVATVTVDEDTLEAIAKEGIAEVAGVSGQGALIVARVRKEVWSRQIDVGGVSIPAGAAFAAFGLGFLAASPQSTARVSGSGSWTRLSTERGHVVIR